MRGKISSTLVICIILLSFTACASDDSVQQLENTVDIEEGYAWGALPQKGKEDAVYCNLPENINGLDNILPICQDVQYDILYYVNYGADYFIYACKDGKTEKIADIPAKRLFCRDGKLYFMAESYGLYSLEGIKDGNILQYDPVTGQISVVVNEQASSMIVYQDGIYYSKDEKYEIGNDSFAVDRSLAYYSFADGSITGLESLSGSERTLYRCGDDFIFYVVEPYQGTDEAILELAGEGTITLTTGMKLGDLDMAEEKLLENLLVFNNFYTSEKEIYYVDNADAYSEFVIYDTGSMTESRYPLTAAEQGAYIVFDGRVYFSDLHVLNLKNGDETVLSSEEMSDILEWCTDGTNLFCLCSVREDGDTAVQIRKTEIQGESIHFAELTEDTDDTGIMGNQQ